MPCLQGRAAARTWLAHGPDHPNSPHSIYRWVDFEELASSPCVNIVMRADGLDMTLQRMLAVRIVAYPFSIAHLKLLNGLLLGSIMPYNFSHCAWKTAVQDYLDGTPLIVETESSGCSSPASTSPAQGTPAYQRWYPFHRRGSYIQIHQGSPYIGWTCLFYMKRLQLLTCRR